MEFAAFASSHSDGRAGDIVRVTGVGTFATVYSLRDQPFVYKVIHASFRASERRDELSAIHVLCLSPLASPALFAVTLPHELHDPTTQRAEVLSFPPLPLREDGESPAKF
ncbi:hypothetical protein C2E23DRAFT_891126 [Lenzites betulinus]|nr:hypothetical protein C2E23DRAFT_891126 [Lenzites betulinus]